MAIEGGGGSSYNDLSVLIEDLSDYYKNKNNVVQKYTNFKDQGFPLCFVQPEFSTLCFCFG